MILLRFFSLRNRCVRTVMVAFFLLCCAGAALAQKPVQVNVTLTPPYSTRISEYYLGNSPKLSVVLVNHDLTKPALQVRLKMTIKTASGAVQVQSSETASFPTLYLDAGVPVTVSMGELAPYFNTNNLAFSGLSRADYQKGFFRDGIVSFCFEAVEVISRQVLSDPGCAQALLAYDEPPLLNQPMKNAKVTLREPTNIIFQWTPRHQGSFNAAFNTEYLFQLAELNDKAVNPQSAFESGKPLFERVVDATAFLYGPAEPLLLPGRRYAWRVQVRQKANAGDGQQFRNNGFSEVYSFDYSNPIDPTPQKGAPVYKSYWIYPELNDHPYWARRQFLITVQPPSEGRPTDYIVQTKSNDGSPSYANDSQATAVTAWPSSHVWLTQHRIKSLFSEKDPWNFSLRVGAKYSDGSIAWDIWRSSEPAGTQSTVPQIRGQFVWAFNSDDETIDSQKVSLLRSGTRKEESWVKPAFSPGKSAFPIPGTIKVHLDLVTGADGKGREFIAAVNAEGGRYRFEIPERFRKGQHRFAIREEASPLYYGKEAEFTFTCNGRDTALLPIVLTSKTTRLSAGIYCPDCTDSAQIAIDILANENDVKKMPMFQSAGFAITGEQVQHDGNNYLILATLRDGRQFRRLLNPTDRGMYYWMRVRYNNAPPRFYPLPGTWTDRSETRVLTQWVDYPLKDLRLLKGVVTFKDQPRRDVRVKITIPGSGVVPAPGKPVVELEATTDAAGNYVIKGLPEIVKGTPLLITVTDAGLRVAPYYFNLVADGTVEREYNIALTNPVLTVFGRLVNESGAPLKNAVITVDSSQQVRSSEEGFYSFKVWNSKPKQIRILANEFEEQTISFQPRKFDEEGGKASYSLEDWKRAIEKLAVVKDYRGTAGAKEITPFYLGLGASDFPRALSDNVKSTETLRGVGDAGKTTMKRLRGYLKLHILAGATKMNGRLRLSDGKEYLIKSGVPQDIGFGNYTWTLESPADEEPFLPVTGEMEIKTGQTTELTVNVTPSTRLSGKIRELRSGLPEDSVQITVDGLPYSTRTDKDGNYSFSVPKNEELTVQYYKDSRDLEDTTVTFTKSTATINLGLYKRDAAIPNIKTIAGFPVVIKNIVATNFPNVYKVTGSLTPPEGVFKMNGVDGNTDKKSLTFKDIAVKVSDGDRSVAVPQADILFEEALINVKAWGWAPVEVRGTPQIRLRPVTKTEKGYSYEKGSIGGASLVARLATSPSIINVPYALPDASLTLNNSSAAIRDTLRGKFCDVFVPGDAKIVGLSDDISYLMTLLVDSTKAKKGVAAGTANATAKDTSARKTVKGKRNAADYYSANFGIIGAMDIAKDSATLDKEGAHFAGYLRLPFVEGTRFVDTGGVRVDKFLISNDFKIKELNFRISDKLPLMVNLQKVQARLNRLILKDIATVNMSAGFGGYIVLKGDSTSTAINGGAPTPKQAAAKPGGAVAAKGSQSKTNDTLFIQELSLTRASAGWSLAAKLKLGKSGIGIKGLTFTTPGESMISMSYDHAEKSFEFEGSGVINYRKPAANDAGGAAAAKPSRARDSATNSMFPIEIQTFQLSTKNWAMYLAAKANIRLKVAVVTLNVDKLVVSVGSKVTMQQMAAYLRADSAAGQTGKLAEDEDPDEPMDESEASWAVGVKGGITIGSLKGANARAAGSFVIGVVNDKFSSVINEIELGIESKAVTMNGKLSMEFSEERAGGEIALVAEIKQTITVKGTAQFYKLYKTETQREGVSFGGSLYAEATNGGIPMGYITWTGLGGGFSWNTSTEKYAFWLTGSFGLTGTTAAKILVKEATIRIEFDKQECGSKPVMIGSGKVTVMDEVMGEAQCTLDLCNKMILVDVSTRELPVPGCAGALYAKGALTVYARYREVGSRSEPVIFASANAEISSIGNLLKGNLNLAFGWNYDNDDPKAPQSCRSLFNNISAKAKNGSLLHGAAFTGTVSIPPLSKSINLKIAGRSLASSSFSLNGNGDCLLAYRVKDNTGIAEFNAEVTAAAEIRICGWGATASAAAKLGMAGGYGDLREEGIREKYQNVASTDIDFFSIHPYKMHPTASDTRKKDSKIGVNASKRTGGVGDYNGWLTAYDPTFTTLSGTAVSIQENAMYMETSPNTSFSYKLKADREVARKAWVSFEYYDEKNRYSEIKMNGQSHRTRSASTNPSNKWIREEFEIDDPKSDSVKLEFSSNYGYKVHNLRNFYFKFNGDSSCRRVFTGKHSDQSGVIYPTDKTDIKCWVIRSGIRNKSYKLKVQYSLNDQASFVNIYANDELIVAQNKKYDGGAGMNVLEYSIPTDVAERYWGDIVIKYAAGGELQTPRIYRTAIALNGKELDWFRPHPKENTAYAGSIGNLHKLADEGNASVLAKRFTKGEDLSAYNSAYDVRRTPISGNIVYAWSVENRMYAAIKPGGAMSFQMDTRGERDLMLRQEYWGGDQNKGMTIFVNDQELGRGTVNEDENSRNSSYTADYPIPNELITGNTIRIRYQADADAESPSIMRASLTHDPSYYEKKMLKEISELAEGTGAKSWYLRGFAGFKVKIAVGSSASCNDYCILCRSPGFKLCLDASGRFSWRKTAGQSADLKSEFSFGSKSR